VSDEHSAIAVDVWFKYEFLRFVFVQQQVEKLTTTAMEFPPMQKGASFNLDAVKANIAAA
jgi:arylsulfatase